MAAEAVFNAFFEEATCSICLGFFQDPVLIPECGHSFCRGCLTRSWGTSESEASCPQCRQTFAPRSLLPIRQLARVLEDGRRCGGPWGMEEGRFCPEHREPLRLFCKDHETLICLACRESKEHRGHSVVPPEEAFQEYQNKLEDCLKAQKEQKEKIAPYKRETEQRAHEMFDLIEEERKNVVAEFRELHLWLEGQEKLLLARMEQTVINIMARLLGTQTEDVIDLDRLIQEIEEKHQQPPIKLLKLHHFVHPFFWMDIGSILKKFQAKKTYKKPTDLLLAPKWAIWDYSDISEFLKSAMKTLRDTLEGGLQLQEVDVTLDPETANSDLLDISNDRKSVKGVMPVKGNYAASSSYGFRYKPYVLGCQRFSTGRHFWEIIVGDTAGWGVGVASQPANMTDADEQIRHWQIRKWGGKYTAFSPSGDSDLVLTKDPTRIRISLNCEGGRVRFFDAKTATLLHTFSDASLVGETLQPSFYLSEGTCMTLPSEKGPP